MSYNLGKHSHYGATSPAIPSAQGPSRRHRNSTFPLTQPDPTAPKRSSSSPEIPRRKMLTLLDHFLDTQPALSPTTATSPDKTRSLDSTPTNASITAAVPEATRQLEQLLQGLTSALQGYGCPTHMLEYHMEQVARGLGHNAQVLVFPNYTMISFDREEYPALGR